MKIGLCCSSRNIETAYKSGADYYEINAMAELAKASDEEFIKIKERVDGFDKIKPYSSNGLVSPDIKLCGPDLDLKVVGFYAEKVLCRLASLGVKIAVLGSGTAREVPEGYDKKTAYKELLTCAEIFANEAKKHNQTIVLEPLNKAETNIFNTVQEGADFVRELNLDNFRLLADFYHVLKDGEGYDGILKNADIISHIHIANKERRFFTEKDSSLIDEIVFVLKEIGYSKAVSFEGEKAEEKELAGMFALLKQKFVAAKLYFADK